MKDENTADYGYGPAEPVDVKPTGSGSAAPGATTLLEAVEESSSYQHWQIRAKAAKKLFANLDQIDGHVYKKN